MYDLMFWFEAFIGPLPKLLTDFKAQLREAYPGPIYDTKCVTCLFCPRCHSVCRLGVGGMTTVAVGEAKSVTNIRLFCSPL